MLFLSLFKIKKNALMQFINAVLIRINVFEVYIDHLNKRKVFASSP